MVKDYLAGTTVMDNNWEHPSFGKIKGKVSKIARHTIYLVEWESGETSFHRKADIFTEDGYSIVLRES